MESEEEEEKRGVTGDWKGKEDGKVSGAGRVRKRRRREELETNRRRKKARLKILIKEIRKK